MVTLKDIFTDLQSIEERVMEIYHPLFEYTKTLGPVARERDLEMLELFEFILNITRKYGGKK